jgi:membrane protease YdiL (CAAX protease family)
VEPSPPSSSHRTPEPPDPRGVLLFFLAVPLYSFGAFALVSFLGTLWGGALAQILFFGALPAVALARLGAPGSAAYFRLPRPGTLLAAGLLVPLVIYFFLQYEMFQEVHLYPSQDNLRDIYLDIFRIGDESPVLIFFAVAIVPPVCEEVMVRGVLLRSLRTLIGTPGAVILSAVFFSLLHLNLVATLLPIFLLGLLLGSVTVMSRSILPAVAIHFLNNLLVVVFLYRPAFGESLDTILFFHPLLLAASLAGVLFLLGLGWRRAAGGGGPEIDLPPRPL